MRPGPDTTDWLRLTLTPGLSALVLRRGLDVFGTPGDLLRAPRNALAGALGNAAADAIAAGPDREALARAEHWVSRAGNALLTLIDPAYPAMLRETASPPPVLYATGRLALLGAPGIAIVGSRSATAQGLRDAEHFARALGDAGLVVVSGLAAGIDAAAHRGALESRGSTIAVLGTGADRVYPARHRDLAHRIAEAGLLLTEFPLATPPLRGNFPRRNRIISGLSRGCLVIEAALESGSLITAREAADQGRDVFALPGSIHSPVARGCHALIKQGAKLVECANDVLEEFGMVAAEAATPRAAGGTDDPLLRAMDFDPVDLDTLCLRAELTPDVVSAILLTLELEGKVAALPGGRFQRLA